MTRLKLETLFKVIINLSFLNTANTQSTDENIGCTTPQCKIHHHILDHRRIRLTVITFKPQTAIQVINNTRP